MAALSKGLPGFENSGCARFRLVPTPAGQMVYLREVNLNGEQELVSLLEVKDLKTNACSTDSMILHLESFRPIAIPGHVDLALTEGQREAVDTSNSDISLVVMKNVASKDPNQWVPVVGGSALLSLQGKSLRLAQIPFHGTEFGALTSEAKGKDRYEIELRDRELKTPYAYSLTFDSVTGKIHHKLTQAAPPAVSVATGGPATADAEETLLVSESSRVVVSLREERVFPTQAVFVGKEKAIYFTEREEGACRGRNLWRYSTDLNQTPKEGPTRLRLSVPCVIDLISDSRRLFVTVREGDREKTLALLPSENILVPWWKGLAGDELWKFDLWQNLNHEAVRVHNLKLLAVAREGQVSRFLLVDAHHPERRHLYLVEMSMDPKNETVAPGLIRAPVEHQHRSSFVMGPQGDIFEAINSKENLQLAKLIFRKLNRAVSPPVLETVVTLGNDVPYIYDTVWSKLPAEDWGGRNVEIALTKFGLVVMDLTDRINEWAVAGYYALGQPEKGAVFNRISGLLGPQISGLRAAAGGLLITEGHQILWLGEGSPLGSGAPEESKKPSGQSRSEYRKSNAGGGK